MSEKTSEFDSQPKPIPNNEKPVWEAVIEDFKKRDELGFKKYKTRLQAFNGRNSIQDCYEEASDLLVYLKQYTIERKEMLALLMEVAKLNGNDRVNDVSYRAFQLLRKLGES